MPYLLYFFYLTRNISGLILVLSPLAGLLYIDLSFDLSMVFWCSSIIGIALANRCSEAVNFRFWTSAAGIIACAGSFLCASGAENTPVACLGACLAGLAAGGLALTLPSCTVIGWFRASKTLLLAVVWSAALALGVLFGILMERNTYLSLACSLVSVLTGTLIFLEKPPCLVSEQTSFYTRLQDADRRSSCLKIMLFSASISFSAFLSCLTMPVNVPFDFFISPEAIFTAGLIAGPAAAGLVCGNKSVYSGCIFMIFLAEIAAAGSANGEQVILLLFIGCFAAGMSVSGLLVIMPVLTFYLSDSWGFKRRLSLSTISSCSGIILAYAVSYQAADSPVSGHYTAPIVFIVLILCFFTLFSSWKHRFFLLKGRRI